MKFTVTLVLLFLFGSPEAALYARALRGVEAMCPCLPRDAACPATHRLAAHVLAAVASQDADPDEALALGLGTAAHETCFRHVRQLGGGPARGWNQLEPTARTRVGRTAQQETWECDPVVAMTDALRVARVDRGLRVYAFGKRAPGSTEQERAAAELRCFVERAREATR